jgi:peptidoglycan/LPS O-acetylase OafA/YrhL
MGYVRILLALVVALGHLPSSFYGAPSTTILFVGPIVAVKLFFVISGFYMAMIFHKHYANAGAFLVSRAIRLFPAYWLTLAFIVVAAIWLGTSHIGAALNFDFWYFVRDPLALLLFAISNLTFIGIDFGYFICFEPSATVHLSFAWTLPCPDGQMLLLSGALNPPAWTLSLEWYFYLLVPLFCSLGARRVAVIAAFSFALAVLIDVSNFGLRSSPWSRAFFPAELYLFLLGFMAWRLKDWIPRVVGGSCAALFIAVLLGFQHIAILDWLNPGGPTFALYFVLAFALPTLFEAGGNLPGERLLGDLSYPIYICHMPVEAVIQAVNMHERMPLFTWIGANILIVMTASALLVVATKPLERIRVRFKLGSERAPSPPRLA